MGTSGVDWIQKAIAHACAAVEARKEADEAEGRAYAYTVMARAELRRGLEVLPDEGEGE